MFSDPSSHLLFSSVLLSRQMQHSLSTVVAAVTAAEEEEGAVPMVAAAGAVSMVAVEGAVSMVAAEDSEATMGVVDPIAGVGDLVAVGSLVVAASEAARDLLAEEVTPTAAGPELAAISVRREIVSRMFLPPSTMASGIRSATAAVPRVRVRVLPRVPVRDAIPEARRTQASPLVTPESPMALGTPLAHQEARPVW